MEKWTKVDLPFQFLKTFGQVVLTDTLTPDDKIEMEVLLRTACRSWKMNHTPKSTSILLIVANTITTLYVNCPNTNVEQ